MSNPEKATLHVVDGGVPDQPTTRYKTRRTSFGGGNGGHIVDTETKNYVDANMRAVHAENNTEFTKLAAKIDAIQTGATWWQIAGIALGSVVSVFTILAYASDRFDSGVASMGAIQEALDAQQDVNTEQSVRIDRILDALERINTEPEQTD